MKRRSRGRGEKALRKIHEAARYAQKKPVVFGDEILNRRKAERAEADAEALLEPTGILVEGGAPSRFATCLPTGR